MEFNDREGSSNVEDRRGMGGMAAGGLGIGGIVVLIVGYFLGIDPSTLMSVAQQASPPPEVRDAPVGAPADDMGHFVSQVLRSTEQVWTPIFQKAGGTYKDPRLVLYEQSTPSACGTGRAAMGPFYCPLDEKVYLDLTFFRDLQTRFNAPGNFPEAYVIAHEIGHHVQKLTGIFDKMQQMQGRVSKSEYNQSSVRLELQADCFAGVWAHHASQSMARISDADITQGLNAASAIGDDRLQRQSQGYVVPESFTHGSSAQRVRWFKRGIESGNMNDCNTFGAQSL
jgi:predicted metalloprotease